MIQDPDTLVDDVIAGPVRLGPGAEAREGGRVGERAVGDCSGPGVRGAQSAATRHEQAGDRGLAADTHLEVIVSVVPVGDVIGRDDGVEGRMVDPAVRRREYQARHIVVTDIEPVYPRIAGDGRIRAAGQYVGSEPAPEGVVARIADKGIVAAAAGEHIVVGIPGDGVVAVGAPYRLEVHHRARAALVAVHVRDEADVDAGRIGVGEIGGAGGVVQAKGIGPALDAVARGLEGDGVAPGTAGDAAAAAGTVGAAVQGIGAAGAVDDVIAGVAVERLVDLGADDPVIAAAAVERGSRGGDHAG